MLRWACSSLSASTSRMRVSPRIVRARGYEVDDVRRPLLPVAVHPAVALLENHQRPRHVEVNEPVALVVQVDPLRRDVGADQQAQRARRVAEVLDHALLIHVAQAAVEDLDLVGREPQVLREPIAQPLQRLDALGEDDQPVSRVARVPVERLLVADRREQRPVLRVVVRPDRCEGLAQDLQRFDFRRCLRVGRRVELPLSTADALIDARDASGGTGEQRLLQRDEEEVATFRHGTRRRGPGRRHLHGKQGFVGGLLRRRRRKPAPDDLPLAESVADLVLDVLLEATDDESLLAEILRRVVVGVRYGRRVQHVHQAGEAARPAIVRRRREHDERVGPAREESRQAAARCGTRRPASACLSR